MENPLLEAYYRRDLDSDATLKLVELGLDRQKARETCISVTRRRCVRQYAWAIPDSAALRFCRITTEVVNHKILDPFAGTGYWARLLSDHGMDVIASDLYVPDGTDKNRYHNGARCFFDVLELDALYSIRTYTNRALFLSWPPYSDSIGADAVQTYYDTGGQIVIYIGEGPGGCVGDDRMHDLLGFEDIYLDTRGDVPDPLFKIEDRFSLSQWPGIHDRLYVCIRIKD